MPTLRAFVVRTFHRKFNSAWAIVRMAEVNEDRRVKQEFSAVGEIPETGPGELLDVTGEWEENATYGMQLRVKDAMRVRPVTVSALEHYLSAVVEGVGPSRAARIVSRFQTVQEIEDVLDNHPERLEEIGIGHNQAMRIHLSWKQDNDIVRKAVRLFLAQNGISVEWAPKIIDVFRARSLDVIQENPYCLTRVEGIGISKCDEIAKRIGKPADSPERTEAFFLHVLYEALQKGHVCLPEGMLLEQVEKLAKVTREAAVEAMERVVERKELLKEQARDEFNTYTYLYIPRLHHAEKGLADRIRELNEYKHETPKRLQEVLKRVQARTKRTFTPKQTEAIVNAFSHHVNIVTGPPGSGKTTIVSAIVEIADSLNLECKLAAPTGRAARRLSEVANHPASTIHRLLEYNGTTRDWVRNRINPLKADILLVDESSMLDVELAYRVLDAIPDDCTLVFVGDVDQLPSVGPGQVLDDLIRSGQVHVTVLDTIFRQAEESLVIRNSHKIRRGEMPAFPEANKDVDSFFIAVPRKGKSDDINWLNEMLSRLLTKDLPRRFPELNMRRDVQILVPMRRGSAGVTELNKVLQEAVNPKGEKIACGSTEFRVGDRIMQMKNDYDLDISNGDVGFIRGFDAEEKTIDIEFYGSRVEYPFAKAFQLELSYVQTIHKSQGGEFPIAIIVMLWQHVAMLERNLLYTANTRAKKMALYVASRGAVERAVETCETKKRWSFLVQRLKQEVKA